MTSDPFAPLPRRSRWVAAAALCVLTLGRLGAAAVPAWLFVAAAVLGLLAAALRSGDPRTQQVARLATAALTVALALALGHRSGPLVLVLAFALVLAAPPAWRRPAPVE